MSQDVILTRIERLILVNQIKILEALYPQEASSLSVQREAFEQGYEMLYSWYFENIYDGEDKMSKAESLEVWDTMDMFDAIARSWPNDLSHGNYILTKFAGYDGNTETKFMAFARFTVERLKRFEYIELERPNYWNAHRPIRDTYLRMLREWKKISSPERFALTREQLDHVLKEAIHPEHR